MKPLENAVSEICLCSPVPQRKFLFGAGPTLFGAGSAWISILHFTAQAGLQTRTALHRFRHDTKPSGRWPAGNRGSLFLTCIRYLRTVQYLFSTTFQLMEPSRERGSLLRLCRSLKTRKRRLGAGLPGRVRFNCTLRVHEFGQTLHAMVLMRLVFRTLLLHSAFLQLAVQAGPETRTTTDLLTFIRALKSL